MLLEVGVGEEEEVVEGVKKEVGVKSQQEEVKKVVQEAKKVEEEVGAVKEAEEEEEVEVGEEGEGEESKVNVPQILTVLLLTPLALNGAFANVRLISLVTRIAGGKAEEVVVVEVVEVVAAVAEAVVVEEVEVEKGCVHLMGIAPLRILYVPNGVSASAPHTSPEGQTAGARVEGEEEVGEPVARMPTVRPQTPSARNGASVSVLNTSLGTLSAILELHRGSLV